MKCSFCNNAFELSGKVNRNDTCPHCQKDLRCCKQCKFFDPHSYNECREVSAERIVEKERANFCDFFMVKGSKGIAGCVNRKTEAKRALEALFAKK